MKNTESTAAVYTSSPARDSVRPIAELMNYDMEGLLAHTDHSVFGTAPAAPPALPRGVFKVTDPRDHFGTAFQAIDAKGSASVSAVEVTVINQVADDRFGAVNMVFQNQDYASLYSSGTLLSGEGTLVALPVGTRAVRVAFLANDQGFIKFPAAVRLRAFTVE